MIFGEFEIQKKKALHFNKNITQVFYKEGWIIFLFQILCRNQLRILKFYLRYLLITRQFSFLSLVPKLHLRKKGLWKFNNSLLVNEEFAIKMKNYIHLKINKMNHENINDDQIRREFLKYKVRKFSKNFSKTLAKELREVLRILENKLSYRNKI